MSVQPTRKSTELASRTGDGLDVRLVWTKRDGRDEVIVRVTDFREGDFFEIAAEPARALDVYYHPFAYRDDSTVADGARAPVVDDAHRTSATRGTEPSP